MISRRTFIRLVPPCATAAVLPLAFAEPPALDEHDPQAQAFGYVADASHVDKAKYPGFAAAQACAACQLYQPAAPAARSGACALFSGKRVAGKGWCSAYVKKA